MTRLGEVRHSGSKRDKAGRGERTFTIKVTTGRNTRNIVGGPNKHAHNYWAKACAVSGKPTERQARSKCFYGTSHKSPTQATAGALRSLIAHHRDPNAFYRKHGLTRRKLNEGY